MERVYPHFIYEKRFLIGKTGKEIKFGEFDIELVGLPHNIEEDEQIYIRVERCMVFKLRKPWSSN